MITKNNLKWLISFIIAFFIVTLTVVFVSFLVLNIYKEVSYFFIFLFYVINVTFVFVIYSQKKQHESKFSWIYLTMLLPIIGHVIFIVYGFHWKNKNEIKVNKNPMYCLKQYVPLFMKNQNQLSYKSNNLTELTNLNNNVILPANIEFYEEGYRFYDHLFNGINDAKKTIYIITYIIKKSEISEHFLSLLLKKANEGVKIKWLVDDFGAMPSQKRKLSKLSKHPNIEFAYIGKIYYPFINASSFSRNHEKFIIIDNKMVFSGGNNISDEYSSMSKKYGHWIDLNYKITGPYINTYIIHFIKFWKIITNKNIEIRSSLFIDTSDQEYENNSFLILESPNFDYSESEFLWLKLIATAKKSIRICTPYFSVTNALKKQLILALRNNVKITIYFPGLPDKKLVYKISLSQLEELIPYGLEVKIYDDHFLHTKAGIVDDKIAWVGTTNWDSRSMFSQYETMDVFEGKSVQKLIQIFDEYDKKSENMKKNCKNKKKSNLFKKFVFDITKPLI
ncbi:phospholipase D-like domain-containing protein [Mycoplasma sp. 4404]|uniref:phospholipase D-like domain-containing protein n=1 Tax=Mycoplasma sp. 4404 TaxID=3108530 RepID=UPI002B1DC91D|nr:phospholipase D-like domain-containing protein [Mycoplasma sp. 4404]MEA4162411.1 phospholipase D-like domain-containing protein [Mycoplasma sp. 4404]